MPFLGFTDETHYISQTESISSVWRIAYLDKVSIICSVPQGSILGPLLFLNYINDMPLAVDSELLLYADDTCLVVQHGDIKTIEEHLNQDFS